MAARQYTAMRQEIMLCEQNSKGHSQGVSVPTGKKGWQCCLCMAVALEQPSMSLMHPMCCAAEAALALPSTALASILAVFRDAREQH